MQHLVKKVSFSFLTGFLLSGCASVQVDRGPFTIEDHPSLIASKKAFLETVSESETRTGRPNILLIVVDDLGKNDMALYDPVHGVHTPHIDSMAASGVVFSRAYSSSAVCSPSRAGIFTGRYQQRYGFERQPMNRYSRNRAEYFFVDHFMNTDPMRLVNPMSKVPGDQIKKQGIPASEILIPEMLQASGYKTALCGKWHLGFEPPFIPNHRGFDYQYGFYEAFSLYAPVGSENIIDYRHDYFANKHIWRQERKGTCAIRVNDSVIAEDEYLTFGIARHSIDFMKQHRDEPFFLVSAFNAPHTPFQVPVEYYNRFANVKDENKRVYYGMIAALDDAVGMMMDSLKELGLEKNTLVIFVSDNGGATYTGATDNGDLKAGKFSQFEGGINIPMIMKWDGHLPGGTRYREPVILLDLFPTIAAAAGLPLPGDRKIDGVNLLQVLPDHKQPHESLYWRTDFNKAIETKKWKLLWNERDGQVFLYDLEKDPGEHVNEADAYPDVIKNLWELYKEWESQMVKPLWPGVMEFRFDIDGEVTWWAI